MFRRFREGLLGTVGRPGTAGCDPGVGCTAIAPGVSDSAVDAAGAASQIFTTGFGEGELSCASPDLEPDDLPSAGCNYSRSPRASFMRPYFMEWSMGLERELGTAGSLKAQYVGTRALNQPYLTQVNGYQTVCDGCFAPVPLPGADRSKIRRGDTTIDGCE